MDRERGAEEREGTIAICLLAALADGRRPPAEQEELAQIFSRTGAGDVSGVSAQVRRGALTLAQAADQLGSAESRRMAYELAVTVIYADGDANAQERDFLEELRRRLQLSSEAESVQAEAGAMAKSPVSGPIPSPRAPDGEKPRPSQAGIPALSHDAAIDLMIRQQALLAGALELLPQGLASLAIIPIQTRLVYRIGADYGQKLDGNQIKDLLGAMGVGALGQLLDGAARRVIGGVSRGLLGQLPGGMLGGVAGAAAGAGVAFASTYALGHAAKQYYLQGRRLSRDDLRSLFERFRREAEQLVPTVRQEIQSQAEHLDLGRLLGTLRGTS